MTNQELATRLGLNHSTVSKYRNGTRTPSFPTMFEIEKVLEWPLENQILALTAGVYSHYLENRIGYVANGQTSS